MKVQLAAQTKWSVEFTDAIADEERFTLFNPYDEHDGTKVVEFAGRTCYMSFEKPRPGGVQAYMQNILSSGHGSVLEHHNFTFWIEGISRTLTHELVRHRAGWAYSQLSQRFVDSKTVQMVVPPLVEEMDLQGYDQGNEFKRSKYIDTITLLTKHMAECKAKYEELQTILKDVFDEAKRKQINEAARCVLPNMTETKIVATVNARALRHFLQMRGSLGADAEIRGLALAMYELVKDRLEFMDFAVTMDAATGYNFLKSEWHKV